MRILYFKLNYIKVITSNPLNVSIFKRSYPGGAPKMPGGSTGTGRNPKLPIGTEKNNFSETNKTGAQTSSNAAAELQKGTVNPPNTSDILNDPTKQEATASQYYENKPKMENPTTHFNPSQTINEQKKATQTSVQQAQEHQSQNPKKEISESPIIGSSSLSTISTTTTTSTTVKESVPSTSQTNNPPIQQANTLEPTPAVQQMNDPDNLELQQEASTAEDLPVLQSTENISKPTFGLGAALQNNPLYKELYHTESKIEKKQEGSNPVPNNDGIYYPNPPTTTTSPTITTTATVSSTNSMQESNTEKNEKSFNSTILNTDYFQPLDPNAPTPPPIPPKPKFNPNYNEESKAFTVLINEIGESNHNKDDNINPLHISEKYLSSYHRNDRAIQKAIDELPDDFRVIFNDLKKNGFVSPNQYQYLIDKGVGGGYFLLSPNLIKYEKNSRLFDSKNPEEYRKVLQQLINESEKIPPNLLKQYEDYIAKLPALSEGDKDFLITLKAYFDKKKSQQKNTKDIVLPLNETETQKRIRILQETQASHRCFTLDDYQKKRLRLQECRDLLQRDDLTEKDKLFVISQSKILQNPDVFHKGLYTLVDRETGLLILYMEEENVKNAEGYKLIQDVFRIIENNPTKFPPNFADNPLNDQQIDTMVEAIRNKSYNVGILKRSPETLSDAVVLTGNDLHYVYLYDDPDNTERCIIFGCKTSTNDGKTIPLSNTQEFNENPAEANRPQRARFPPKLVTVKKKEVIIIDKVTAFAHGINKEGESVHDKIFQSVSDNRELYKQHPLENIQNITADILTTAADITFTEAIVEVDAQIVKMQKIEPGRKLKEMESQEKQKKNEMMKLEEQQFVDSLDIQEKALYKIFKGLLNKDNSKNKNKAEGAAPLITTSTDPKASYRPIKKDDDA